MDTHALQRGFQRHFFELFGEKWNSKSIWEKKKNLFETENGPEIEFHF